MKKKTLFDLYVIGKEFTLEDNEQSETVWIQKINQNEHEKAYRNANKKRAEFMIGKKDINSPEALSVRGEYAAIFESKETLCDYLANLEVGKKREVLEAEIEDKEEWKTDGHLQGLYDSWQDHVKDGLALDPDNEEYKKVYDELLRFYQQVEEKATALKEREVKEFMEKDLTELENIALEKLIASEGDTAWIAEYKLSELYYAVRDADNHRKYYFDSREELDQLPFAVLTILLQYLESISVSLTEGKD